ncbi:MAG: tetratricopeptide repeat protein [Chthoniobacterales bacterium]
MKIRSLTTMFLLLVMGFFVAYGAKPSKSELESMYDKAFSAFNGGRYGEAITALDSIDARQPELAESLNLRGVVYMRQGKYDKAETALRKALKVEPRFWNASFNLAEIPFLKKDWGEARNRFTELMGRENSGIQPETNQLIQYKILLTFVLQGKAKTADWIMDKFEANKDSPALYYSNAALALQNKNQKEAQEWMDSATKQFSEPLNKLYAESFYEIGWMEKPAGEGRAALEITSTTERADRLKSDAKANFETAERAFQQRKFVDALKSLDLAEAGAPNDPASLNLRAEILMEQGKMDEADGALNKAIAIDPNFREAQYNLAQLPFKKGEYAKARDRFEALFAATPGDDKNQAAQLIKYKIFMTLLLEGKDPEAKQMMDQFKFTGDTPALYYAQAAWEYKHDKGDEADDWVASARKIYSPALNVVFADSFYDLGWLKKSGQDATPATAALAQADASPGTEVQPAMRTGQAGTAASPETSPEATASPAPASETAGAVAAVSPSAMAAPVSSPASKPAVAAVAPSAAPSAVARATVAARPGAAAIAAPETNDLSPVPGETSNGAFSRRSLLVGGLLLAGILLLVWLVVQQFRRNVATVPANESSQPLTEPAFESDPSAAEDGHRISPNVLSSGPPQVSLQLKASEPAVRTAALPSGAITARGSIPGVNEPPIVSPNESETVSPEKEPAVAGPSTPVPPGPAPAEPVAEEEEEAPAHPLRDQEEVSLPVYAATPVDEKPFEIARALPPANVPPPAVSTPEVAEASAVAVPEESESLVEESVTPAEELLAASTEEAAPTEKAAPAPEEAEAPIEEPVAAHEATIPVEEVAVLSAEPAPSVEESIIPLAEETAPVEEPEPAVAAMEETHSVDEPAVISEEPAVAEEELVAAAEEPIEEPAIVSAGETEEQSEETDEELEEAFAAAFERPAETAPDPEDIFEDSEIYADEPVGQGQPIPHLTTAFSAEPVISELAQPEPESELVLIEPEDAVAASIAGRQPVQSSIETPSFAPKIITTEPIRLQPIMSDTMPETTITPAPVTRPSASTVSVQQPAGGMHTAVQLTFSLEIASMQLTPTFKMSGLQLKPMSKVVSMRIAPSQDPQPPMNLQVTFEVAKIELSNGSIGTVRLMPSAQQKPAVITSPSFAISGLELVAGAGAGPVQLTPSHQEQASVQLTAEFQIAAIEFTPAFEIATIVLNSTSRKVSMQLPGAGPSSIDNAPIFDIENVQIADGGRELNLIQVAPGGMGRS